MDHKPPPGAGIPSPVPPWGPLRALGEVTHMTPLTQMKALKLRKKSMAKVPPLVTTGPEVSRHPLRTIGVRVGESDRQAPPCRLLPQQGGDQLETVLGTRCLTTEQGSVAWGQGPGQPLSPCPARGPQGRATAWGRLLREDHALTECTKQKIVFK